MASRLCASVSTPVKRGDDSSHLLVCSGSDVGLAGWAGFGEALSKTLTGIPPGFEPRRGPHLSTLDPLALPSHPPPPPRNLPPPLSPSTCSSP